MRGAKLQHDVTNVERVEHVEQGVVRPASVDEERVAARIFEVNVMVFIKGIKASSDIEACWYRTLDRYTIKKNLGLTFGEKVG